MIKEIPRGIKAVIENFRKDQVMLERIPEDLRSLIWNSDPAELRQTVRLVNEELLSLGQRPLSYVEFKDAEDGNEWASKRRSRQTSNPLNNLTSFRILK